jgi:hypothetical protein
MVLQDGTSMKEVEFSYFVRIDAGKVMFDLVEITSNIGAHSLCPSK